MKDYKRTQIALNTLSDLLTLIQIKEEEVKTAIKYNKEYGCIGLNIDVQKIKDDLQELEFEFRELTLTLRI